MPAGKAWWDTAVAHVENTANKIHSGWLDLNNDNRQHLEHWSTQPLAGVPGPRRNKSSPIAALNVPKKVNGTPKKLEGELY